MKECVSLGLKGFLTFPLNIFPLHTVMLESVFNLLQLPLYLIPPLCSSSVFQSGSEWHHGRREIYSHDCLCTSVENTTIIFNIVAPKLLLYTTCFSMICQITSQPSKNFQGVDHSSYQPITLLNFQAAAVILLVVRLARLPL